MDFIIIPLIAGALIGIITAIYTACQKSRNGNVVQSLSEQVASKGFTISRQINSPDNSYSLLVDDDHSKWGIIDSRTESFEVLKYSDLIEYELLEDGDSIIKGRVGSAIVGGALFGGIGAIAGAARSKKIKSVCNSMSIKVAVNNIAKPMYYIPIITSQVKIDSMLYNTALSTAHEFTSLLAFIKAKAEA